MAFGHTDDVPNTIDPEAQSPPESSSLSPDVCREVGSAICGPSSLFDSLFRKDSHAKSRNR
ncbi:MAG: hypothetical protein ACKVH8_02120 [Pirellulales bacterium]